MSDIYKTKKGTVQYRGTEDGNDHTYNPKYAVDLINNSKFNEAIDYLNSYSFSNPEDYQQCLNTISGIEELKAEREHKMSITPDEDKGKMYFMMKWKSGDDIMPIYNSDGSLDNTEYRQQYNDLCIQVNKTIDDIFGEDGKVELQFFKKKQKLFNWGKDGGFWDSLRKDNEYNNIDAWKKRLAQAHGLEDVSNEYLAQHGIEIKYDGYDGSAKVVVDKNSMFVRDIINNWDNSFFGRKKNIKFTNSDYNKDNSKDNLNVGDRLLTAYASGIIPYINTKPLLKQGQNIALNELYNNKLSSFANLKSFIDKTSKLNEINNNEVVPLYSTDYALNYSVDDDFDEAIAKGGTAKAIALQQRKDIVDRLITAMHNSVDGGMNMIITEAEDEFINIDENNLFVPINDDIQRKFIREKFNHIGNDDRVKISLNIRDDGKVGYTFYVEGAEPTKTDKKGKSSYKFTVYDWNTKESQELIDSDPEIQAAIHINKMARFHSGYKSYDGKNYNYMGGYGKHATFEDENGNRVSQSDLVSLATRDRMLQQYTNSILTRYYTRAGNRIGNDKDLNKELDYMSMSIAAKIFGRNPLNYDGKPLTADFIRSFINQDEDFRSGKYDTDIPDNAWYMLDYIAICRHLLDTKLSAYNNQLINK